MIELKKSKMEPIAKGEYVARPVADADLAAFRERRTKYHVDSSGDPLPEKQVDRMISKLLADVPTFIIEHRGIPVGEIGICKDPFMSFDDPRYPKPAYSVSVTLHERSGRIDANQAVSLATSLAEKIGGKTKTLYTMLDVETSGIDGNAYLANGFEAIESEKVRTKLSKKYREWGIPDPFATNTVMVKAL